MGCLPNSNQQHSMRCYCVARETLLLKCCVHSWAGQTCPAPVWLLNPAMFTTLAYQFAASWLALVNTSKHDWQTCAWQWSPQAQAVLLACMQGRPFIPLLRSWLQPHQQLNMSLSCSAGMFAGMIHALPCFLSRLSSRRWQIWCQAGLCLC
jgi:hypothetical protein